MGGRIRILIVGCVLLSSGCEAEPLEEWLVHTNRPITTKSEPVRDTQALTSIQTGTIRGRVVWNGQPPEVEPFSFHRLVVGQGFIWGEQPNPNVPQISTHDSGVGDVLIYLRGRGLESGQTREYPPVVAELDNFQIRLRQGDRVGNVALVRPGDSIEIVSKQAELYSLQARGAAFFTVRLPIPDLPLSRPIPQVGEVRLTSASNHFWAEAHLIACEHPYYCVTAADGSFELPRVPPGEYDLICRVSDWHVDRIERDPETGSIARQWYAEPVIVSERIKVNAGETTMSELSLRETMFGLAP